MPQGARGFWMAAAVLVVAVAPCRAASLTGLKLIAIPGKKLVVVSKDPGVTLFTAPAANGAALLVTPAASAGATIALPAGPEWSGTPGILQKYKNAAAPGGPSLCKVAVIKAGKVLKVVCKDVDGLALPVAGDITVTVDSGVEAHHLCFPAGAIVKNDGTKLIAKNPGVAGPCAPPPAACCGAARDVFAFTVGTGAGTCGSVVDSSGGPLLGLSCGGLYFGAGQNSVPLPATAPDYGTFFADVTACDAGTGVLTLGPRTAARTASDRNCTAAGCLYGAPLPIPNPSSPPTSTCVVNSVSQDLAGAASCTAGTALLNLPLNAQIFLTGDLLPDAGVQPCPLCDGGTFTCRGGPNDGDPCTPEAFNLGGAGPTSHDCPPDPLDDIGGLPIPYELTTGSASDTATASGTQQRVFCGFCRDQLALGTGSFEAPSRPCQTNADCSNPSFPDCEQRDNGAFAEGAARTITATGASGGDLTDGGSHAATLASVFCVPPTFDPTVDNAANLPGPGAVSLVGAMQLR